MNNSQKVIDWRRRTKNRIIEAMGGKCVECGYAGYPGAFDLHHINPSEKEFTMGGIRANPIAWSRIVEELRKCTLLCANCHREVEGGYKSLTSNTSPFDESFVDYTIKPPNPSRPYTKSFNKCNICNTEFETYSKRHKFCSDVCKKLSIQKQLELTNKNRQRPRKTAWPERDQLIADIESMSWVAIGKKYGVSDNAVRKWARSYGLI